MNRNEAQSPSFNYGVKYRVMFLITTSEEAKAFLPVHQELIKSGLVDIINIGTGKMCCERDSEPPEATMERLQMEYVSLLAMKIKNIVEVLREESPDLVITGGDQEYIRRAFLYGADGLNIPTLLVQVGISSDVANIPSIAVKRTVYRLRHYWLNIIRKYVYLLRTVVALRWGLLKILKMIWEDIKIAVSADDTNGKFGKRTVAVSGSWGKKTMLLRGVDSSDIVVVGRLVNGQNNNGDCEIREMLGIGNNEKVVLFLTCAMVEHGWWTTDMRSELVNRVIDSIMPLLGESVRMVIKIHPVERIEDYKKIIDGEVSQLIICQDVSLDAVINISDVVVVGGYSTTVLEVATFSKPVLLLNMFNDVKGIAYEDMGIATEVNDYSELQKLVRELLNNPLAKDEVVRKVGAFWKLNKEYVDGKAVERTTGLILKLAKAYKVNK